MWESFQKKQNFEQKAKTSYTVKIAGLHTLGQYVGLFLTQMEFNSKHWVKVTHSWEGATVHHPIVGLLAGLFLTQHF